MRHIINFDHKDNIALEELFTKIAEKNTILFLGAGASVGKDKGFLSKDLITFYQDKKGLDLNINNIIEFVDVISNTSNLSRDEFDAYVDDCLRKLKITESHKILASLPWRQIITTNYDLLVEQAFEQIQNTPDENLRLRVIRDKKELSYSYTAADELLYVKLHGCISNKVKYPLIFSSDDFKKSKRFYKNVLDPLRNLSDKILFLSIGYSYSDSFAKELLEKIDSIGFRERRVIYSIDPYIPDSILPLYSSKGICIIKTTMEDFFERYKKWEKSNFEKINLARKISFTTSGKSKINLNYKISRRLYGNLIQLNDNCEVPILSEVDFYKGEEPNYNVINKHFDIIKKEQITKTKEQIFKFITEKDSKLIPIPPIPL